MDSFNDLARFVCAFREYPLRAHLHDFEGNRIISSGITLSNTLVMFYAFPPKTGRYISYHTSSGKEFCDIVNSTQDISIYAPIIHYESKLSPLPTKLENFSDQFHPVKLQDLGSLARLTYDPEFPDEQKLTLYCVPNNEKWIIGYITSIDMDDVYYQFNYVELETKPTKPFLKYQGNLGKNPEFTDSFEHGYSYLPIINVKVEHPLFGLN